ncbi:MAG: hypothetical protein HY735_20075 [Verrucomicrobia bacterium]|nr:hypothetical protein [Verrucomicrobiota bacterium]
MNNPGAAFIATTTTVPVGKLPTGAGRLPAPPIFQMGSRTQAWSARAPTTAREGACAPQFG